MFFFSLILSEQSRAEPDMATALDNETLYKIIQHVIANNLSLPMEELCRSWGSGFPPEYNPLKSLFSLDKKGRRVCIWSLDVETWESIGDGYCQWVQLPEHQRIVFWMDILRLMRETPEWTLTSTAKFKNWIYEEICKRLFEFMDGAPTVSVVK